MAMARTLTISTIVALAFAAPASAGMTWEFAGLVARDHWQQEGISLPCAPSSRLLTWAEEGELLTDGTWIDMLADPDTCQVLVTPSIDWYRNHGGGAAYCEGVVHEFGHLAGLSHDHGGVMGDEGPVPFGCAHPRQFKVLKGWRKPPRWVRRSPARIERLWLSGRVWRAQVARARWLERR